MKILRLILPFLFAAFIPLAAIAQTPQLIYNGQFSGTGGTVLSGATLTWASGSSLQLQFGTVGANRLVIETNSSGLVGTVGLGAGLSISGGNLVAGSSSSANPTASVGLSAVNGTATTYMTSDSAPALSQAIVPTWTGLHKFSVTSTITSGSDYGIEILPTLNQRNATNFSLIFGNETVTQAGTGNQYLEQLQVGGTNEWVVNSAGAVTVGAWNGTVIGSNYGGAGAINGPLSGNGSGVVALATSGTGIVVSSGGIAISSLVATNASGVMTSNALLLGNTSPDIKVAAGLNTDGTSQIILGVSGTSVGKVAFNNATSGSITVQPVSGALGTAVISLPAVTGTLNIFSGSSTSGDVAVFSNSTGSIQDLGVLGVATNTATITTSSSSVVPLVIANAGVTSNAFSISSQQFAASMGTGNEFVMEIGVANTTDNTATIGFHYTGSGNTGNYISFGFNGANDVGKLDTLGNLSLTSMTTAGVVVSTVTTGKLSSVIGSSGMATLGPLLGSSWSSSSSLFLNGTGAWSSPSGSGTVNSGTANQIAYYATSTTAVSGNSAITINASTGALAFTTPARSSGAIPYLTLNIPTDTGLTASTEAPGFQTVTATRTWATTGTVTLQREYKFAAPTYASASASQTFTTAATLDITGAPIAGTNAIITNAYALNVEAGTTNLQSLLASNATFSSTLTANGPVNINNSVTMSAGNNFILNGTLNLFAQASGQAALYVGRSSDNFSQFLFYNNAVTTELAYFQSTATGVVFGSVSGTIILQSNSITALTLDGSSNVLVAKKISSYNGVSTAGWGIPAIYGSGRATAQVAAQASVATYTVGAADGTFEVSANILVTASVTNSFTCTCTYTDEGNTSRTLTLSFSQISGVLVTTITNVTGTGAYEGVPLHIRCKASTSITIATVGTFTSVTYNAEGIIKQES